MTKFLSYEGLTTYNEKVKSEIKKVSDASIPNSKKGAKNGVATLDANGYVPLSQLGNLDTTVAEVVASLPTTNIKKHIYMVAASSTTSQNVYKEYIYTGDTTKTYDASKWEQLGEYKASVDLSGYLTKTNASDIYLTKTEASTTYLTKNTASTTYLTKADAQSAYHPNIKSIVFDKSPNSGSSGVLLRLTLNTNAGNGGAGGYGVNVDMPNATTSLPGLMSESDKSKLNGLNKITIDTALSSTSTNPVQNKVINTALAGKASTAVASTSANGLMSSTDKKRLDGIADNANNYVLPVASDTQLGGIICGNTVIMNENHLDVKIDTALSSTSVLPVQNKVVYSALAEKATKSELNTALGNIQTIQEKEITDLFG